MERIRMIGLGKSFGVRQVFSNVSFEIKEGDRLALVGPNGAGKSTLLKCILGYEELDEGLSLIHICHVSKDGLPEPVLFYQLPYISEDGINTPDMLKRLYELRDYARHNIDTVVSVGIGGSYLGSKVIFDVQCGAFWNNLSTEERNGYPRMYFAGFNVDGDYLAGLIRTLEYQAQKKGPDYKAVSYTHLKRKLKEWYNKG